MPGYIGQGGVVKSVSTIYNAIGGIVRPVGICKAGIDGVVKNIFVSDASIEKVDIRGAYKYSYAERSDYSTWGSTVTQSKVASNLQKGYTYSNAFGGTSYSSINLTIDQKTANLPIITLVNPAESRVNIYFNIMLTLDDGNKVTMQDYLFDKDVPFSITIASSYKEDSTIYPNSTGNYWLYTMNNSSGLTVATAKTFTVSSKTDLTEYTMRLYGQTTVKSSTSTDGVATLTLTFKSITIGDKTFTA